MTDEAIYVIDSGIYEYLCHSTPSFKEMKGWILFVVQSLSGGRK